MQKQILKLVPVSILIIFLILPNIAKAEVIFQDNFNSQSDWTPNFSIGGITSDVCSNGWAVVPCSTIMQPPVGWDWYNNNELWNPYDSSNPIIGSHPSHLISGNTEYGLSNGNKAHVTWNEDNFGSEGNGFGNDGILAKQFDPTNEIYAQFRIRMSPDWLWRVHPTLEDEANGGKIFRILSWHDNSNVAPFIKESSRFFSGASSYPGNLGPIYIFNISEKNPASYGFRAFTSSRCGPTRASYVKYSGKIYKCIKPHTAGNDHLPDEINSAYWQDVTSAYSADYARFSDWILGTSYFVDNYWCGGDGIYDTASPMFTKAGVQSNSYAATFGDGNWHTVKLHVKMKNDVNDDKGTEEIWINGQLSYSRNDILWLGPGADPDSKWNIVGIGGNASNAFRATWQQSNYNTWHAGQTATYNGYTWTALQDTATIPSNNSPMNYPAYWQKDNTFLPNFEQWYAIDDVVISTTDIPTDYVVPNSDTTPPSAPTGLSVM